MKLLPKISELEIVSVCTWDQTTTVLSIQQGTWGLWHEHRSEYQDSDRRTHQACALPCTKQGSYCCVRWQRLTCILASFRSPAWPGNEATHMPALAKDKDPVTEWMIQNNLCIVRNVQNLFRPEVTKLLALFTGTRKNWQLFSSAWEQGYKTVCDAPPKCPTMGNHETFCAENKILL